MQITFFKLPGLFRLKKIKLLGHKWLPSNLKYHKKPLSFNFELFGIPGVLFK